MISSPSPEEAPAAEIEIESGADLESSEPDGAVLGAANNISLLTANTASVDEILTRGVASVVTFADTSTERTQQTQGRKIKSKDVKDIFRGSTTTGTVSVEQVERIKRMHDKICDGVNWDFNYSCLLMVASIVAGLGLASDSSTTVISSMLLSPIMGPVIGMSYGLVIWDLPLIKRSARNELISILVCIIFGLIIGISCHWTEMAQEWPTQEMLSRGTRQTFLIGIPIAFFSGLGVALSVLDDQTSSLVGVAISASLLPPAVNCGMLLIMAAINGEDWNDFTFENEPTNYTSNNFSQMGVTSLLLTIVNVIMVALGATLMFRAKEVLPVKKKIFWDDLKIARRIYTGRAIDSVTGERFSSQELRELNQLPTDDPSHQNVPKHSSSGDQIPNTLS